MRNKPEKIKIFFRGLSIPALSFFVIKEIYIQKRFLRSTIAKELLHYKKTNDGSLTEKDYKKILNYYALGVPAIFGSAVLLLRNKKYTSKEHFCLTYLGGLSGLLDDFFDDPEKDALKLEKLVKNPEILQQGNSVEKLLQYLYLKGLKNARNPTEIKAKAFDVFCSQRESLQQREAGCSQAFLKAITWKKGGNAFLYYLSCFDELAEEKEQGLFYQLGGLLQLGNDIFDVWEDYKNNWHTIATDAVDIKEVRKLFSQELQTTLNLVRAGKFNSKAARKFNRFILLAVSRVFICLDQFEELQNKWGGKFEPSRASREQLICDMQKRGNQIKMIRYYLNPHKYMGVS